MKRMLLVLGKVTAVLLSLGLTAAFLLTVGFGSGSTKAGSSESHVDVAIMDRYDMYVNNRLSTALEGVLAVEKVYWLTDDDLIAPEPDQSKFGRTTDPASLDWLLEEAAELLEGQETVFNTEVKIAYGTEIIYYLDETIFAITWKEAKDGGMYTFSEVKIKHPSQLRRFLAGGEYGSEIQLKTTQMAQTVNAVVASSGDFYGYRRHGVIVYDGIVRRVNSGWVDTCYIDDQGNMIVTYAGQLPTVEAAQAFVDARNIRFSMAFGPVLVDHGERPSLEGYFLGQIDDPYPRAALCQKGKLHYIVVAVNGEKGYYRTADLYSFARNIYDLDVEMAYTLDGGQTAAIVMNDELINAVLNGSQRPISDIFYFATAVSDGS